MSRKTKGSKTNVLYNLGLAESKNYTCPRTKAASCQCESVNKITEAQETVTAVCVLEHSDTVEGTILFKQQANGPTLIVGKITGLEPGEHGFHIHEFGDLSQGCESAGGHYNPDGVDHGELQQGHVGDLGNITADDSGTASIKIVADRVDLIGERSVVGRSVVVHADQDDLGKGGDAESLKTGNAGDRLACGVITLKETIKENFADQAKAATNVAYNENFIKDTATAIKLVKRFYETGNDKDAFAAIKHGWNFIKNPKMRSIIVNLVKKLSTDEGLDWNETVAYIKKNTGIDVSNVNENFADGKKKGKSRPGRVKRSGASCNGSVTDLRKRAKNASGEKAKMYHWCANMKSGKKK
jgi:Cu-Zn family superoxide dismutase